MTEAWKSGTRVIWPTKQPAAVTVVFDDVAEATDLLAESRDGLEMSGVELRASFVGPSRGAADILPDILIVAEPIALGVVGSGVWFAVQTIIERIARRRRAKNPALATALQTITVIIPTAQGPAMIERVSLGPHDLDGQRDTFERIAQSMIKSSGGHQ